MKFFSCTWWWWLFLHIFHMMTFINEFKKKYFRKFKNLEMPSLDKFYFFYKIKKHFISFHKSCCYCSDISIIFYFIANNGVSFIYSTAVMTAFCLCYWQSRFYCCLYSDFNIHSQLMDHSLWLFGFSFLIVRILQCFMEFPRY